MLAAVAQRSPCSRRPSCSAGAGSRSASTRAAARARAPARALPDALLLLLVALGGDRGALGASARCSPPRCSSSPPRPTRLLDAQPARRWQLGVDRAGRRRGRGRPLALGRGQRAAGRDDRRARRRRSSRSAALARALTAAPRGGLAARRRRLLVAVAGGARRLRRRRRRATGVRRSSRRRRSSATGRAASAASAVDVHQILRPNTDPHEYEPRPSDVDATAAGADGRLRERRRPRPLDGASRRRRPAAARGRRPRRARARCAARRDQRPRGLALRPPLVARPAQRRARPSADPRRADAGRPGAPRRLRAATRPPTSRSCARLDARHRRVLRAGCPPASASSSPTTTRSATSRALRHPRRRRRDPVADDPGAAVGGRARAQLIALDPARARAARSSPRPRSTPQLARTIAARDRRHARATRSTATRSAPPAPAARPTSAWRRANADAMVRGFTGGAPGLPIAGL